jgi:hypothetical protein
VDRRSIIGERRCFLPVCESQTRHARVGVINLRIAQHVLQRQVTDEMRSRHHNQRPRTARVHPHSMRHQPSKPTPIQSQAWHIQATCCCLPGFSCRWA